MFLIYFIGLSKMYDKKILNLENKKVKKIIAELSQKRININGSQDKNKTQR